MVREMASDVASIQLDAGTGPLSSMYIPGLQGKAQMRARPMSARPAATTSSQEFGLANGKQDLWAAQQAPYHHLRHTRTWEPPSSTPKAMPLHYASTPNTTYSPYSAPASRHAQAWDSSSSPYATAAASPASSATGVRWRTSNDAPRLSVQDALVSSQRLLSASQSGRPLQRTSQRVWSAAAASPSHAPPYSPQTADCASPASNGSAVPSASGPTSFWTILKPTANLDSNAWHTSLGSGQAHHQGPLAVPEVEGEGEGEDGQYDFSQPIWRRPARWHGRKVLRHVMRAWKGMMSYRRWKRQRMWKAARHDHTHRLGSAFYAWLAEARVLDMDDDDTKIQKAVVHVRRAFTRKAWRAWGAVMTQRHVKAYKKAVAEHFQNMHLLRAGLKGLKAARSYSKRCTGLLARAAGRWVRSRVSGAFYAWWALVMEAREEKVRQELQAAAAEAAAEAARGDGADGARVAEMAEALKEQEACAMEAAERAAEAAERAEAALQAYSAVQEEMARVLKERDSLKRDMAELLEMARMGVVEAHDEAAAAQAEAATEAHNAHVMAEVSRSIMGSTPASLYGDAEGGHTAAGVVDAGSSHHSGGDDGGDAGVMAPALPVHRSSSGAGSGKAGEGWEEEEDADLEVDFGDDVHDEEVGGGEVEVGSDGASNTEGRESNAGSVRGSTDGSAGAGDAGADAAAGNAAEAGSGGKAEPQEDEDGIINVADDDGSSLFSLEQDAGRRESAVGEGACAGGDGEGAGATEDKAGGGDGAAQDDLEDPEFGAVMFEEEAGGDEQEQVEGGPGGGDEAGEGVGVGGREGAAAGAGDEAGGVGVQGEDGGEIIDVDDGSLVGSVEF